MPDTTNAKGESNAAIRFALIGVLVLFGAAIWYALHVTAVRQNNAINTVLPPTKYTNYVYKINLAYPSDWQPAAGSSYDHYEGANGFFMISAVGTATSSIDDLAAAEAGHILKPYGSKPVIDSTSVAGQRARIIMPSSDQAKARQESGCCNYKVSQASHPQQASLWISCTLG
jgi:hypothetical protein